MTGNELLKVTISILDNAYGVMDYCTLLQQTACINLYGSIQECDLERDGILYKL